MWTCGLTGILSTTDHVNDIEKYGFDANMGQFAQFCPSNTHYHADVDWPSTKLTW